MELHAEAYRRALAPFGIPVTDEEIFDREGARSETIIAEYLQRANNHDKATVKRVSDAKQETFRALGPPPLYPGAENLVRKIREAAYRLGLVTGTRRENLTRLIPHLVPLFDALLAQDAYSHDKPHPEPYAKTVAALGLGPNQCAALENAPRGIKSARAAGLQFVVGIATTVPRTQLADAGAHVVVDDHHEATRVLLDWIRQVTGPREG